MVQEPYSFWPAIDPRRQEAAVDLACPFGNLDGLSRCDFRDAAYEIFFSSCRSTPGFGGKNALTYHNSNDGGDSPFSSLSFVQGSPKKALHGVGMAVTSKMKRALGLKMIKKPTSRRTSSVGSITLPSSFSGGNNSPRAFSTANSPRTRRPLTSAEIMRQQMRVTEARDNMLRKTLMRTLVGQMGRRVETIILPLELLRHLKPSEFNGPVEYHAWQRRQLKILEAGLLLNPSIPLEKNNAYAKVLGEIVQSSETRPIDTGKNSEAMRSLCNSVVALAWRSYDGSEASVCHWADGSPLNVHIYMALLSAIFDQRDGTLVLDEVDELLELMKKTWNTLGIDRSMHNLCFTWVLFEQYVMTGQVEQDLLGAALVMLNEVATDAKRVDREATYVKMLGTVILSMKKWAEKGLFNYHRNFHKGTLVILDSILPFVFSANSILDEDVWGYGLDAEQEKELRNELDGNKVDNYIRSSLKYAFAKMLEEVCGNTENIEWQQAGNILIKIAKETEDLAMKEKEIFSPHLKKWHPIAGGVAAVTLHSCYGILLKQYLTGTSLTNDTILVLEKAANLEKVLIRMIVEDSGECEDGGKAVVREMAPYEVESLITNLQREWIQERLKKGRDTIDRAKETETWNPKSKHEPYASSASDLVSDAKEAIENFFEMPIGILEDSVKELANGLENLFREYITFIASCGSKENYIPSLPPLTRCNHGSTFTKIWKRAGCNAASGHSRRRIMDHGKWSRPSTSRGTQRLYIRINTLHYLLSQLHLIEKTIFLSLRVGPKHLTRTSSRKMQFSTSSYFDSTRQVIKKSLQRVAEVAAYRLIFLDSSHVFYENLYAYGVSNSRISPALKITKQNLTLLCAILTDKAQTLVLKEVMKAAFEAYLRVLLAGGTSRFYTPNDQEMIEEDFKSLQNLFCTCGEGLISKDLVDHDSETVEGVIAYMGLPTEQLVEDFCIASETGDVGVGRKVPLPLTTGKWNRSDPNTILRVLCYRNDITANHFLKRTFNLPRRTD